MDFAELYKTDVTKQIEKKGKFSYLSWPYAVSEFRKACPNGTWHVQSFGPNDQPYCATDAGCFVKVVVYPDGMHDAPATSFQQIHPVLDNRNKTLKEPDAFQINTSIQRCLVKAIALATGIGLHIYAGEDLPTDDKPAKKAEKKWNLDGYIQCFEKFKSADEAGEWMKKFNGHMAANLTEPECLDAMQVYEEKLRELE